MFFGSSLVAPVSAANPSADLDQCANDPAPSPSTDGCTSSSSDWVNGNLGASKSVYYEGDSVYYNSTIPHHVHPAGDGESVILAVIFQGR